MKKRIFSIVLALVLSLSLAVPALAAEEPEPEYRLTKVVNSRGLEYTFVYGQGGYQPTEVLENGTSYATASYDEAGRITTFQNSYRSYVSDYDEEGNCVRSESTYDYGDYGDGLSTTVSEYSYDEDGNCVQEERTITDSDGTATYAYGYTYNEDGSCAREEQTNTGNDGAVSTSVTEYVYDEDGNCVRREKTSTDSDGIESTRIIEYTYDEEGRELSMVTTSDTGEGSKGTYTYSEDGRSKTSTYDDGEIFVEYEAPLVEVFWDNYTEYFSDGTTYQSKLYQIDFWDSTESVPFFQIGYSSDNEPTLTYDDNGYLVRLDGTKDSIELTYEPVA